MSVTHGLNLFVLFWISPSNLDKLFRVLCLTHQSRSSTWAATCFERTLCYLRTIRWLKTHLRFAHALLSSSFFFCFFFLHHRHLPSLGCYCFSLSSFPSCVGSFNFCLLHEKSIPSVRSSEFSLPSLPSSVASKASALRERRILTT